MRGNVKPEELRELLDLVADEIPTPTSYADDAECGFMECCKEPDYNPHKPTCLFHRAQTLAKKLRQQLTGVTE